ncbi:hypothetical protein [Emticicia sp.]|uniref:hypothetical protein n=1 Tax=Emticicia sp. TaxID=1930953 RepID=UPI003753758D
MKTSNFLLFLAIYGFITGGMMLFNAAGSLENFGVPLIDQTHIVILQYLGLTDIALSLIVFLQRNEQSPSVIKSLLITYLFITIGSFLKALYDVYIINVPSNTFFWVDMSVRLLVGLVCVFYLLRIDKKND